MRRIIQIIAFFFAMSVGLYSQSALQSLKDNFDKHDYDKAANFIAQAIKDNPENQDVYIMCGDIYEQIEKYQDALNMYLKADDIDRNKPEVLRKIGREYSLLGNKEQAFEYLNKAVKKSNEDAKSLLELAYAYLRIDSVNKAELLITRAKEMDSKNPDALIALGDLYFKQKVYQLSADNYAAAIEINPDLIDARMKLATSYYWLATREIDEDLSQKLYQKSLEEWNTITKMDPNNAKAFFEQGKIFFFAQQFDKAALSLNNFIILRPSGTLGRWYLVQSLEKIGRCDSAITHLEVVIKEIDSVRTKAKLMLARCLFDDKQYSKAIEGYLNSEKDTALSTIDYQKMGQAYLLSNDTTNAIAEWNKAIKLSPEENCSVMQTIGYIYQKQGNYPQAIEMFRNRLNIGACSNEKDYIAYYLLGSSYFLNKMADSAIAPLKKSIVLDSTFLMSSLTLADAYASLGMKDTATSVFRNTIAKAEADTAANSYALKQAFAKLCGMELEAKEFTGLIKTANEWIKYYPDEPYGFLYLAVGYHSQGTDASLKEACKYYRKVIQIDPKNEAAKKNLASLVAAGKCE